MGVKSVKKIASLTNSKLKVLAQEYFDCQRTGSYSPTSKMMGLVEKLKKEGYPKTYCMRLAENMVIDAVMDRL